MTKTRKKYSQVKQNLDEGVARLTQPPYAIRNYSTGGVTYTLIETGKFTYHYKMWIFTCVKYQPKTDSKNI